VFAVVVATSLLFASPARAQSEPADEAARAVYDRGAEHYAAGRFEAAAADFERAYALSRRPQLFYNLYLAYRDSGERERAATALRRFLASDAVPPEMNRAHLEARLRALEADEPAPEPPEEEGGGTWWPGWVIAGGGGALLVTGAITGIAALDLHASVEERCDAGGLCPASTEPDRDLGAALALATDVLLPAGAAIAIAGVVLALALADDGTEVAAACGPGGCAASLGGVF
jgi:tetratricopeptide (TPR) repeat protein